MSPARPEALRVLQVTPRALPELGGTETHVHEVGRRLAARGDVDLVLATTDRSGTLRLRERSEGVEVRRVPAYPRSKDWYLAPDLLRTVRSEPWDVVHLQGVHTAVAPLVMATALAARLPLVVSTHTGGHDLRHRSAARSAQWRVLGPMLRRADAVLPVARFEQEMFTQLAGVDPARFTVVRNGGSLPPVPADLRPVPGRVLSIGRLTRYKGHHRAVAALPALVARVPEAHLHVLGAGPEEGALLEQAASLGVADRVSVRFVPPSERGAMGRALAEASAVVALSDYEAHPVAVAEALSVGVPVVGADVAGIGDLVADGLVTGVALDADPAAVAAALAGALGGGRRPAQRLATWDDAADAVAAVYHRVSRRRVVARPATIDLTEPRRIVPGDRRAGTTSPTSSTSRTSRTIPTSPTTTTRDRQEQR